MRPLTVFALTASLALLGCPTAAPPCSATTCPTGCCDTAGRCQAGTSLTACGLGGRSCMGCPVGQMCLQGLCSVTVVTGGGSGGGTSTGGGDGGGSATSGGSATGGGSSTGGGSATGGGATGGGAATGGGTQTGGGGAVIEIVPPSASIEEFDRIDVSARVVGGVDNGFVFTLLGGPGSLQTTGPSTAVYFALTPFGVARVQALAVGGAAAPRTIEITVDPSARRFSVVPDGLTPQLRLSPGARQSFAGVRVVASPVSPFAFANVGLEGLEWRVWPTGTIAVDGTLTAEAANRRVYAREPRSNIWSSTEVLVQPTTFPAIAVSPALTTVAPRGVVQFTATVSTGEPVEWVVDSSGGGTISDTGTYTAPASPGVYVVSANVGFRGQGYATIVVR